MKNNKSKTITPFDFPKYVKGRNITIEEFCDILDIYDMAFYYLLKDNGYMSYAHRLTPKCPTKWFTFKKVSLAGDEYVDIDKITPAGSRELFLMIFAKGSVEFNAEAGY